MRGEAFQNFRKFQNSGMQRNTEEQKQNRSRTGAAKMGIIHFNSKGQTSRRISEEEVKQIENEKAETRRRESRDRREPKQQAEQQGKQKQRRQ